MDSGRKQRTGLLGTHSLVSKFNGTYASLLSVSGECGWSKLWSIYGNELYRRELKLTLTAAGIKRNLTAEGVSFEAFVLPSTIDITDCFIPGEEKGELLLDWLTSVVDFRHTAPPELKASVMNLLRWMGEPYSIVIWRFWF